MADSEHSIIFGEQRENGSTFGFAIIRLLLDEHGEPFDWEFLQLNDWVEHLNGKSADEMLGHRYYELFPYASRRWLKFYYQAAYERKNVSITAAADNRGIRLHIEAYPADGEGCCAVIFRNTFDEDIEKSDRIKENEELRRKYEKEQHINDEISRYTGAVGAAFPLVVTLDYKRNRYEIIEQDKFILHSAANEGSVDDYIGGWVKTIPDKELAEKFSQLFGRESAIKAFESGRRHISLRHPQLGDDGQVHYMVTNLICTECSDEGITAIALARIIDDEAERDRLNEMAVAQANVIGAISTLYVAIVETDLATGSVRVVKGGERAETALGEQSAENHSRNVMALLANFAVPEQLDEVREFMNLETLPQRLEGKDSVSIEFASVYGRHYQGRFIASRRDESGNPTAVLFVARDITWEKERELRYMDELKAAAAEADAANLSKTNFLRRMSHDIRTPLNGIIGMLGIMDANEGDKAKYEECMNNIKRSSDYLLNIVNNVLDISRMESGGIELEHKPFDLAQILLNTLPLVATNAAQNGLVAKGGREDTHITHRYVIGSPVHLNRVLMNIASNAIKYNRPGGSLRIYCNELKSDSEQAVYEFVCEDTGLGMSEEFQKHAFDPFTREGKTTTTGFSGSGLGLSIVKQIIDTMGGTIELKSREGEGTTVRIVLAFPLDKDYSAKQLEEAPNADIDFVGRKALLVEDNDINMEIATVLLENLGFEITKAQNGKEAVDIFAKSDPYHFDIIFMDMMMPVMDGIEATKAIRALPKADAATVPIIAMTANAFVEDRQACLDAGMNEHIGKPIDAKSIIKAVSRFIK